MNNPKISVILPIYNVEDYLEETLNSILNQTIIDDIEVLMIDDGSTDNSRYIIENYALDYDNFYAFHKNNEGQGIARNFALKKAKGDYIHFFDSDDYIPCDAYETLYNLALKNKSDIIICDVLRFGNNNLWSDSLFRNSFVGISHDIESTTLEKTPSLLWDTSTSNKLYKKDFLQENNIKFPQKKIFFEDLIVSLESYIKADSIYVSKYIFYYWRYRGKKTSVTQQHTNIKNFYDRLEILKLISDLMIENNLSEDLINLEYRKWLDHDLKIFLKKLINYPVRFHQELIDKVNEILNIIPNEFLYELNSFKQIIYEMVKNNDIDGLLHFAHLEDDLKDNPIIPESLDEKYHKFINFSRDCLNENFSAKIVEVLTDDKELIISFNEKIGYADSNKVHNTFAYLVDVDGNEYELKVINGNIYLPIDLIKNKNDLRIKIIYKSDDLIKETFLKNNRQSSFNVNLFDIDFYRGIDNTLSIWTSKRNKNEIIINTVDFEDDYLIFKFKSQNNIARFFIKNLVTDVKFDYFIEEDNEYQLKIPYEDILNAPIKKWILNCHEFPNSFIPFKKLTFYTDYYKIDVSLFKNKILIKNSIFNYIEELENDFNHIQEVKNEINVLKKSNKKINKSNKKLDKSNKRFIDQNKKLNEEIDAFKSRRLVKIADKLNKFNF